MKNYLLSIFLGLVAAAGSFSQGIYPVTVVPQTIPPAPIYLSSYADATVVNGPLQVQIILNDLSIADRQVTLKAYVEGNGIAAESNAFVSGAAPMFLESGVPLLLTHTELTPYFAFENLTGISPSAYGAALPEGVYQFCFEVYDALTNARLSEKTCARNVIFRNDPPLLVLPSTQSTLQEQNPQYMVFQWTPRHLNVSNVNYELSLVEIWDDYIDPQAAFFASQPIFQVTTQTTSYVYGPSDPLLLPGKKYAWRVQAKALSGAEEIGLFTNNGYSEVFWFRYEAPCAAPLQLVVDELSDKSARISWLSNNQLDFTVKYREKGSTQWYEALTPREYLTVNSLKPETTYQYQVSGNCDSGAATFSTIYEFTTLDNEASAYQGCNIDVDPVAISNQQPISMLYPNDVITAGDFPVTILQLDKNTSPFKGKGFTIVPWLGDTKIGVEFDNIMVNTDMQLYSGEIKTTYDANWSNVDFLNEIVDLNNDIEELDIEGEIQNVYVAESGNVVVVFVNEDGEEVQVEHSGGQDYVIRDSNGNVYNVDEEGNVTQGDAAEGGEATAQNTSGVNSGGSATQLTSSGVTVTFEPAPAMVYGYDKIPENQRSNLASRYRSLPDASGDSYDVINKAVKNTATDVLYAKLNTTGNSVKPEDIKFRTKSGVDVAAELLAGDNTTYKLTLQGISNFEKEEIQAYIMPEKEGGQQTIAGVFDLYSLGQKEVNITLIPVNGVSLNKTDIEQQLNAIYNKAAVNFTVTIGDSFTVTPQDFDDNGDNALEIGTSGFLSSYTAEQRNIINKFKTEYDITGQMYYVFVSNDISTSRGVEGFMPLMRRYGFVFTNNMGSAAQDEYKGGTNKVLAHELGHGVFGLPHPFDAHGSDRAATSFLMDYGAGTDFSHMDWEQMHNPDFKLYLFQDDEEGEFAPYQYLAGFNVVPDRFSDHINATDGGISFVTRAGTVITLPSDVSDVTFNKNGLLIAFTVNEGGVAERYVSATYRNNEYMEMTPKKFAGFRKNTNKTELKNNQNLYTETRSFAMNKQNTRVYLGFLAKEGADGEDCGIKLYESNYPVVADQENHSGGEGLTVADPLVIGLKLSIEGGQADNPVYQDGIRYMGIKVSSPEACELCTAGAKFVNTYTANVATIEEYEALYNTAKAICNFPDKSIIDAFAAEKDKEFKEKLGQWLLWESEKSDMKEAREAFWAEPNAWQVYYKKLNYFLNAHATFKTQIADKSVTNANIKAVVNARTPEFLDLYTIEERIGIIRNLLPEDDKVLLPGGAVNWAELMVVNSEENAILNVLKSVSGVEDAGKMLAGLSEDKYIERLTYHIDDLGFGGDNFTALAKEFRRLMLEKNDIETQPQQRMYIANHPETYFLLWNKENLFFPDNEEGIISYNEVSVNNDKLHIEYRISENCRYEGGGDNGAGGIEPMQLVCDYTPQPPIDLNYFDPVIVSLAGDLSNQLPQDIYQTAANGIVTYAGFIHYLKTKRNTAQNLAIANYTLTGISLVLGVGEIVAIVRAGASLGRIAIVTWDMGSQIVTLSTETSVFKEWCRNNPEDCAKFNKLNMINQIAGLSKSGLDIAKNWKGIKAVEAGVSITEGVRRSTTNLKAVNWTNDITGWKSSTKAMDIWNDTSKEFKHYMDGDFYLKFDESSGALLFGNHTSGELLGLYEGARNIDVVNNLGFDAVLSKLKIYHGVPGSPLYVTANVSSGARIIANPDKTATIIGNYVRYPYQVGDMKQLVYSELLGDLKTAQFGAKKSGFNVLNVSEETVTANGGWDNFWTNFNEPWLNEAMTRGDDIWAASSPFDMDLMFKNLDDVPVGSLNTPENLANYLKNLSDPNVMSQITGFGKEVMLLSKNGYIYDVSKKMFVK